MSLSNPRGYSLSDWSVLQREEGSNSVSLLWVYWVSNDPLPHTSSLISHATSLFTLDVIDPADACRRNITLWYSRTVATSCRSNLSQFGCWEKQFHLPVQKIVTRVLVLRTLSWVHLNQASLLLCSLSKAGSTSRPSGGEYYSQRGGKNTKHHICDFTCLLVLSNPTISQRMYRGDASPCLHQTWKRRAHASRPHPAQIAFFPTLLVRN